MQDILDGYLNNSKGKNSQKEEIWQCLVPRLTMASSAALNKSLLLSSSNCFSKKSRVESVSEGYNNVDNNKPARQNSLTSRSRNPEYIRKNN